MLSKCLPSLTGFCGQCVGVGGHRGQVPEPPQQGVGQGWDCHILCSEDEGSGLGEDNRQFVQYVPQGTSVGIVVGVMTSLGVPEAPWPW